MDNKLREIEESLWELAKSLPDSPTAAIWRVRIQQNSLEWLRYQRSIIDTQVDTIKRLTEENERLMGAIRSAHSSLTWSNTENQIPHAVWHLENVLPERTENNRTKARRNRG